MASPYLLVFIFLAFFSVFTRFNTLKNAFLASVFFVSGVVGIFSGVSGFILTKRVFYLKNTGFGCRSEEWS